MIDNCEMKNENGFCLCSGGVCGAVYINKQTTDRICNWMRNAYMMGKDPSFKPRWVTAVWVKVEGQYAMRCTNCGSKMIGATTREQCPDFCFSCHADMRRDCCPENGEWSDWGMEMIEAERKRL